MSSNEIPAVLRYMTPAPVTIDSEDSIEDALGTMHKHGIRHLPVIENQIVVGLLSERDLGIAGALSELPNLPVKALMEDEPFLIGPRTTILRAVQEMISKKIGSAVIIDEKRHAMGIFTAIDAMRALVDLIQERESLLNLPDPLFERA